VHSKLSALIAACGNNSSATASTNDQWQALELRIAFYFNRYKKGIQIEMYDVPFHMAK
jgi:hypothetical protein